MMTTEDICNLPIPDISARHSLCLMWCTWPKLVEGLQVLQAWGFEYVSKAFVWVKLNPSGIGWHFGTGYHTHGNSEFVLIGKRGNGISRADKGISELIIYPRGQHSTKPPIVKDRIISLYGDVKRCELFARQTDPNFATWGNEVPFDESFGALNDFISPPYTAIVDDDEFEGLPVIDTKQLSYSNGEQMRML